MSETQRLVTSLDAGTRNNGAVGEPRADGPSEMLPTISISANDFSAEAEVR